MSRALFISKNLLGDGMNIYPALKTWWNTHQDWDIDLYTLPDQLKVMYQYMGIPLRVITSDEEKRPPYDLELNFDCGTAFTLGERHHQHIALGYCQMLNVQPVDDDWRLRFDPPEIKISPLYKNRILIAPFSKSCSSQSGFAPNKMLPWEKWKPIIRFLSNLGPIGILGSSGDRASELEVPETDYITGFPLEIVAQIIKASKLVVTIDNGISHLAASQMAKMVLFYPACLQEYWITPIGNPNLLCVIQMDPNTVDAGELLRMIKQRVDKKL